LYLASGGCNWIPCSESTVKDSIVEKARDALGCLIILSHKCTRSVLHGITVPWDGFPAALPATLPLAKLLGLLTGVEEVVGSVGFGCLHFDGQARLIQARRAGGFGRFNAFDWGLFGMARQRLFG